MKAVDGAGNEVVSLKNSITFKPLVGKELQVGNYVDTNDDGIVDGVIYSDNIRN